MRVTVERAAFLKALSRVQGVVERRNTIPILSNVLLNASDQGLEIAATDLDVEVIDNSLATVLEPGSISTHAHTLFDVVRKFPEGADILLECSTSDQRLGVEAGRSKFKLPTINPIDFPRMTGQIEAQPQTIESSLLLRILDKTKFAMSSDETRYYLNGIHLHIVEGANGLALRAVATDGSRLAYSQVLVSEDMRAMTSVIVPRKTVGEIRRILAEGDTRIRLQATEGRIYFEGQGMSLTSKVIDGSYPDYMRIIPVENDRVIRIDAALLSAAIDRVSTISTEPARSLKMAFEPGRLVLTVRNMETAQAVEELEVGYEGPPFETSFNARYLLDVAGSVDGDHVDYHFGSANTPVVITDTTDADTKHVVMPLRF